ncbi:type I-E CRISPR-associated protein Cas7/Cse4/CasC [Sulfitobacter sp. R18_1]|uniref:type I-E CRISPR-associated protein Cas7/Cse4/CasC n=1 Tax=Sulfitobacter sp. R18_1 TaxID=2821104 RepID=UPI001AD9A7D0|nr:type I-E CRISPR-associated protein Cas7/Cse4/CasC [Sulfitobacter sp. R18_1]MBO9428844.1 type I-E CRISPR-associated protein Cas7/Cse4/CasC [Sulfitobacter sp. R18_1]
MKNMFIQFHSLTPFGPSLLNRDDFGRAKAISLGGVLRTRVSSQCLKYHWRHADGPNTLQDLGEDMGSVRTRNLVTELLIPELAEDFPADVLEVTGKIMNEAVYGQGETKKSTAKKSDDDEEKEAAETKRTMLLFGMKEIAYLKERVREAAIRVSDMKTEAGIDKIDGHTKYDGELLKHPNAKYTAKQKEKGIKLIDVAKKVIAKDEQDNFKAMREKATLAGGIPGALFGRMVTGDRNADIDGAVSVAHSVTVHESEAEIDPFTAVDDLVENGSGHMGETEVNTSLFYGYTVLNIRDLLNNLGGDKELAAKIARTFVYMIAEPRMTGKTGSTAPYTRASSIVVSAGDRAPMSYVEAFRKPTGSETEEALEAMSEFATVIDHNYGIEEDRRYMLATSRVLEDLPFGNQSTVAELADWVEETVKEAADALA